MAVETAVTSYLVQQGALGIAVICLGIIVRVFYKDNQKKDELHTAERKEFTDRFIQVAQESVQYIQENSGNLKGMREELKEERGARDKINARMLETLDHALRDYRKQ